MAAKTSSTFEHQDKLPRLPIPPLRETCARYLRSLSALQDPEEHAATRRAVAEFLGEEIPAPGGEGTTSFNVDSESAVGPKVDALLKVWETQAGRGSYVEEFWYDSYLSHSDPVVLALNPFFVLENDPTPSRGTQLPRAASLIIASLGFIHDLRAGILPPDNVRGIPLCMDQYTRLFGTSRIPTERGCKMQSNEQSRHIVVIRRGQFYHFPVLDSASRPLLTEREVLRNLQAIVKDADVLSVAEVARSAVGVLTTENRKTWSKLREALSEPIPGPVPTAGVTAANGSITSTSPCFPPSSPELVPESDHVSAYSEYDYDDEYAGVYKHSPPPHTFTHNVGTTAHRYSPKPTISNAPNLDVIDNALFVVCLDDVAPDSLAQLCENFLCGTYQIIEEEDVHTKKNNHTSLHAEQLGVQVGTCMNRWYDKLQIIVTSDGSAGINFEHTGVDGHTVLRFAADIYTQGLMLMARSINPSAPTLFHAQLSPYAKSYKASKGDAKLDSSGCGLADDADAHTDTTPKKLEWHLTPALRVAIRFAETRLSDLICQNDCQALEFKGYGKNFITSHGFSPDAFVQMAFQAAYFGLYGRIENVYEPAMTKGFLHGRTEAIRSVQPESVAFTKTFFSESTPAEKVAALRTACIAHAKLTKACGQGLGQDRHLYALYCLLRKKLSGELTLDDDENKALGDFPLERMPTLFTDPGWELINTSILSTSNCGNPALRLFGFGPVAADGYGIGYIIKEDGISVCASSKHLQTRRFLATLQGYLHDMQRILIHLHRSANERAAPFVDHLGVLRDSKTGRAIGGFNGVSVKRRGSNSSKESNDDDEDALPTYSFFECGDVELLGQRKKAPFSNVGKVLQLSEY